MAHRRIELWVTLHRTGDTTLWVDVQRPSGGVSYGTVRPCELGVLVSELLRHAWEHDGPEPPPHPLGGRGWIVREAGSHAHRRGSPHGAPHGCLPLRLLLRGILDDHGQSVVLLDPMGGVTCGPVTLDELTTFLELLVPVDGGGREVEPSA